MLDNKGFDLWADGYDAAVGLSDEENSYPFAGYKDVLGMIFREVMAKKNAKVLDIGFGTGTLTTKLYENECDVYGQDFSQRMIELAQQKMEKAHLYQGDFYKGLVKELVDLKYDYIIGTYSLHHLTDEQKISFFKSLTDRLNEGGKLLIGDVAFETRAELEKCREEAADDWDEDEIYFVLDELREAFPGAEFYPKSYCSGVIEIKKVNDICVSLYIPKLEDLWFREEFMADPATMEYNHAWGGTIPFPKEKWEGWYNDWVVNDDGKCFYRYLKNTDGEFVGEVAYHIDSKHNMCMADVIIASKYRGRGYGKAGLLLLCEQAKDNGMDSIYDNIAIDNTAVRLFIECGFTEEYRTEEIIMLKKQLV